MMNTKRHHDRGAIDSPGQRLTVVSKELLGGGLVLLALLLTMGLIVTWSVMQPRFLARQDRLDRFPGKIVEIRPTGGEDDRTDAIVRFGRDSSHFDRTATVGGIGEDRWKA